MSNTEVPDLVEHASSRPLDATIERLVRTIVDRGMTIFARIDRAANGREAGTSMPPSTVLHYRADRHIRPGALHARAVRHGRAARPTAPPADLLSIPGLLVDRELSTRRVRHRRRALCCCGAWFHSGFDRWRCGHWRRWSLRDCSLAHW
jgi:hypothetical protein